MPLITALAWMTPRASVTLAGLLTAILLPWALLTVRRSVELTAMTVLALALLWRGEAWKTVFLQSERQLSELQRQLQRPTLSNTELSNPETAFLCDAVRLSPTLTGYAVAFAHELQRHDSHGPAIVSETPQALRPYTYQTLSDSGESFADLNRFSLNYYTNARPPLASVRAIEIGNHKTP